MGQTLDVILQLKDKLTGQMGVAIQKLKAQQSNAQGLSDKLGMSQVKAMKAAQSEIPGVSRGLDLLTNKYTLIGAGVAAAGGLMYKAMTMSAEWQQSLAKLNVTANLKPAELKALGNEFLEMGKKIPVQLEQIPMAFEKLISSGMDIGVAKKALEPVLKASKANVADINIVADAMSSVMASSGNNNANQVMDILQATQIVGKAEFQDIASYLPRIIPVARAAGISLNDTAAQFAFLTSQGMKSEQVSTALENIGLAMSDNKIKANFKDFGVNLYSKGKLRPMLDIITDIKAKTAGLSEEAKNAKLDKLGLNQQAGLGIKNMLNDTEKLKEITEQMQNPVGALEQAYKMSATPMDDLLLIWNNIKTEIIKAGGALWDYIAPPLAWIRTHMPEIKLFIEGAAKAIAIFAGGWLLVNGAIMIASGAMAIFNALAAMNPFAWIGIAAVAIGLLYAKFEGFRAVIDAIWAVAKQFFSDFIGSIKQIISGIVGMFSGLATIIAGALNLDWKQIKAGAKEVGNGFDKAVTPIANAVFNPKDYTGTFNLGFQKEAVEKAQAEKEKKQKEAEEAKTPSGLQQQPDANNKTKTQGGNAVSTDEVTKTGGAAKSITIHIGKLAEIQLQNTMLEKGISNKDIERAITETLVKCLRNIETSYA